jgi:enoyl-CoA hydratase/carnithine racemase
VLTERHGPVVTLRLDNPPHNLLTTPVMIELRNAVARLERDASVRAVVLAGAQRGVFIGHYDVEEILAGARAAGVALPRWFAPVVLRLVGALTKVPGGASLLGRSPAVGVVSLLRFHRVVRAIRRSGKVFVAAIDGPASGGGFELALACDVRVMGDGPYEAGLVESLFGLVPGGGGSELLIRALGAGRALELLLEGRLLGSREAFELGLVHHVVDHDKVLDHARQIAERLATRPPDAVRAIKDTVGRGGAPGVERAWFLTLAGRKTALTALDRYSARLERHHGDLGDLVRQWRDDKNRDNNSERGGNRAG